MSCDSIPIYFKFNFSKKNFCEHMYCKFEGTILHQWRLALSEIFEINKHTHTLRGERQFPNWHIKSVWMFSHRDLW
jgi:hypothetical protein